MLEKLISFNTINDQDNLLIMDFVGIYLKELGFKIKYIFNSNKTKKCLIANLGKPIITFIGHTDTVGCSNWEYDPFKLTINDNKLYGLGTCDMKGGISAFLCAVDELINEIEGIQIVLTYDEETSFEGINLINKDELSNNIIIGEPTCIVPITNTKGCIEYKVSFKGISAHSSEPNKGDNAIIKCLSFIDDLTIFYNELQREENKIFEIPYVTMNIAKIKGGDSINIIPDNCEVSFDFRTINKKENLIIIDTVSKLANKYKAEISLLNNIFPLENNNDISYIESITCKKSGINYVTEASFIENKNIIILGPGPANAHKKDEYIDIESYEKIIDVYKKIIKYYLKK